MRSFADACRALIDAPGADHSLYTTLAPLYEALRLGEGGEERFHRQFRLARERLPLGTGSVLEVGCGLGGLLPLLAGAYDEVVGLDRSTTLLAHAAERTDPDDVELVAADFGGRTPVGRAGDGHGDPGRDDHGDVADGVTGPMDRQFDAVLAFGYVLSGATTDAGLRSFARATRAHLRPGGTVVCDAVADPVAVTEEPVQVYHDEGFRLERAVDVVPARGFEGVEVVADYRATDRSTGETGTATERLPVRTFEPAELETAMAAAGLADVTVERAPDGADEGTLVATASRPVETE